jgi:calcium permeable stress-gated cation channel
LGQLKDSLSDTTKIAYALARSLGKLASFYVNLIILQGVGMFPFRLLQFGNVALYPITYVSAKTPRDLAELNMPPIFSYGFFLPQPILVFIICIVYSVLPSGALILVFGLIYFVIGYLTYKYQLLYSMDNPQHSTGQAWSMIFYRVVLGLIVFQLAMAGFLAINGAVKRSLLITPLLLGSVWLAWLFSRLYVPLNRFIALKVVQEPERGEGAVRGETIEEAREKGDRFINPNLVMPCVSLKHLVRRCIEMKLTGNETIGWRIYGWLKQD